MKCLQDQIFCDAVSGVRMSHVGAKQLLRHNSLGVCCCHKYILQPFLIIQPNMKFLRDSCPLGQSKGMWCGVVLGQSVLAQSRYTIKRHWPCINVFWYHITYQLLSSINGAGVRKDESYWRNWAKLCDTITPLLSLIKVKSANSWNDWTTVWVSTLYLNPALITLDLKSFRENEFAMSHPVGDTHWLGWPEHSLGPALLGKPCLPFFPVSVVSNENWLWFDFYCNIL